MSTPTPTSTVTKTPTSTNYILKIGQLIYDAGVYDKNNLSIYYKGYNFTGKILADNTLLHEPPNATVISRPTRTPTTTPTLTPTVTTSVTRTPTSSVTRTPTSSVTRTPTPTITTSKTSTPTPTVTQSVTVTNTTTPTNTKTPTKTVTPTFTSTPTKTTEYTICPDSSNYPEGWYCCPGGGAAMTAEYCGITGPYYIPPPTPTPTKTTTQTPTNTSTPTRTSTLTPTPTITSTVTTTVSPTKTTTPSITPSKTSSSPMISSVNSMVAVGGTKTIAYSNDTTSLTNYTDMVWSTGQIDFGITEIAPRTVAKCIVSPSNTRTFIINTYGNDYATSTNGISWTKKTFSSTSDYTGFYSYWHTTIVAKSYNQLGSNRFMAIGNEVDFGNGLSCYLLSTDLNSWSKVSLPLASNTYWLTGAYGNNTFILIPSNSTTYYTSSNGTVWTARSLPYNSSNLTELKYTNNKFIAIFKQNSLNNIIISSDGINWTTKPTAVINPLRSFVYFPARPGSSVFTGNTYVFLHFNNNYITYSNDSDGSLTNFVVTLLPFSNRNSITTMLDEENISSAGYDPAFVVVVNGSFIALSPNLSTWTYRSLASANWTSITS